jgi:hypothetical protein
MVVTRLNRTSFGKRIRRVEKEGRALVIEIPGTTPVVLLSNRDYLRLAVLEPEVLRIVGNESKQKGTAKLNSRQIDKVIKAARQARVDDRE